MVPERGGDAAVKLDHAGLVDPRHFAGLDGDEAAEAAEATGVSPATADRMMRYARAWLLVELNDRLGSH